METSLQHTENAPGQNKDVTISVNGKDKTFQGKKISFRQVVLLAYPDAIFNDQIIYRVNYSKGEKENPKGSMVDGDEIPVKDEMIFNVTRNDNS